MTAPDTDSFEKHAEEVKARLRANPGGNRSWAEPQSKDSARATIEERERFMPRIHADSQARMAEASRAAAAPKTEQERAAERFKAEVRAKAEARERNLNAQRESDAAADRRDQDARQARPPVWWSQPTSRAGPRTEVLRRAEGGAGASRRKPRSGSPVREAQR